MSTGEGAEGEAGGLGSAAWKKRPQTEKKPRNSSFYFYFFLKRSGLCRLVGAEKKLPPRPGVSPGSRPRRRVRCWSRASGARSSLATRSLAGLAFLPFPAGVPEEEEPGVDLVPGDGIGWR